MLCWWVAIISGLEQCTSNLLQVLPDRAQVWVQALSLGKGASSSILTCFNLQGWTLCEWVAHYEIWEYC